MQETYITEIGSRQGARYARRHPLHIDLRIATGQLEDCSTLQIRELHRDLGAELARRGSA